MTVGVGFAIGSLLAGCASDDAATVTGNSYTATEGPEVSITLARTPRPSVDTGTTAVYGILANNTDGNIRALSATSPAAQDVVLQQPVTSEPGTLEKVPGGFLIEVEGGVVMEPGGFQLTLVDVDSTAFDQPISITLQLDTGNDFTFTADVIDGQE